MPITALTMLPWKYIGAFLALCLLVGGIYFNGYTHGKATQLKVDNIALSEKTLQISDMKLAIEKSNNAITQLEQYKHFAEYNKHVVEEANKAKTIIITKRIEAVNNSKALSCDELLKESWEAK